MPGARETAGPAGPCPCDSGADYQSCCGPLIERAREARTAEELMRARYTAYTVEAVPYVMDTTSRRQRGQQDADLAREWSRNAEWLGLEVVATREGGERDQRGEVEFIARYRVDGKAAEHHEISRFRRERGHWRYDGGKVLSVSAPVTRTEKVGRNDPCPCGSRRKYKKCCGA